MSTATVPSAPDTAASLRISDEQAVEAYRSLADAHVYVLEPADPTRLRMANPFSAVPSPFEVVAVGKRYFGNCIWDGLGIVSLMGGTGKVMTTCPDCGEAITLVVRSGALVGGEGIVHFRVPAAHWWDDIIYT